MEKTYYIIDFDSTFVQIESLDTLAKIALENHPRAHEKIAEIEQLTKDGMDGLIPFSEGLRKRVALPDASKEQVHALIRILKKNLTPSVLRNKSFFKKYADDIYIISGGFTDFIVPVVSDFGIARDHVLANTFVYSKNGAINGFDKTNPLARENGKVKAVKQLNLSGSVIMIGDGITDYQVKERGLATKFYAFVENVERQTVTKHADAVIASFDEFLYRRKLPSSLSFPKSEVRVLLFENIDPEAVKLFEKEGYHVQTYEKSLAEIELYEKVSDAHVIGVRSRTKITDDLLSHAPNLLAAGAFSVGTDQVDLPNAALHGTAVFNAPYSNTRSVVELAIGNIIMLFRNVFEKSMKLHQGVWDKSAKGLYEVRGKKLGIIGYGNIGSQLSVLAESMGMEVYFYDIVERLALGNAKKTDTLSELLKKSDIVSLHAAGGLKAKPIFAEKEFKMMKDGSYFINLARGSLVDMHALYLALKTGKLKGAALDVFPKEPKGKDEPFVSELLGMHNVILTPHIGGSTEEAQKAIGQFVANKIIDFINTGNTAMSVNMPNIQLSEVKKAHRLLHMHRNVPGVMAQINKILVAHDLNVMGQYLKTNETVGYVIMDVDKKYDKVVLEKLKQIPETIRFRVLY